jgi:RNA-directed DNA polymerase
MLAIAVRNTWSQNAHRFLSVKSDQDICALLGASFKDVQYHLNKPLYYNFTIPKKRGSARTILAPNDDLKQMQRRLNFYLQAVYAQVKPEGVHGFIKCPGNGTQPNNVITNATQHVNKRYVLNIDVKDFFESITDKMVYETFLSLGLEIRPASILTMLSTYQHNLPTGAPSSPIISNIVCQELDKVLTNYCVARSITFTRYADDLTFSRNYGFAPETILELRTIIKRFGFDANEKKLRQQKHNQRQVVTGLVVNKKVNVNRKYRKQLRAVLHDIKVNGLEVAAGRDLGAQKTISQFHNVLCGKSNWISQVRNNV